MKHYILLLTLLIHGFLFGQTIKTDIFKNLNYTSYDRSYEAQFKKNIFDDFVFSDNHNNEITFKAKYIAKEMPELKNNKEAVLALFIEMVRAHKKDKDYKATYEVDIFDKLIFKDNKGSVEIGTDIFGNPTYEENIGTQHISVTKGLNGAWEYKNNQKGTATLKKDIFDIWHYTDSYGNDFEFGKTTWGRMMQQHKTEENVFRYLIQLFF